MIYIKELDYIFKDENKKKHVGEISEISITPTVEFDLLLDDTNIWCILEKKYGTWQIHLPTEGIAIDLDELDDVRNNSGLIFQGINKQTESLAISKAIYEIYIRNKNIFL